MSRHLLIAVLLAIATSCVPQKQWRTQAVLNAPTPPAKPEEGFYLPPDAAKNRLYSFSFVEFKNDGHFADRRQLDEALKAIDLADRRSNHHALVIVFVHGWKNNARETNNNVLDFRKQINRIAFDVCGSNSASCGVAGVYLSWNGDQIQQEWGTLRQLSIFNRRGVARQVSTGDIGPALLDVMKQIKQGEGRERNLSVVVGHSFGGLILEAAIAEKLKKVGDQLAGEVRNKPNVEYYTTPVSRELADLIVLINEAAPAVQAFNLLSDYRDDLQKVHFLSPPRNPNCRPGDTQQDCKHLARPLVLAVSSESDLATKVLLPVSERISPSNLKVDPDAKFPPGLDAKKISATAAAHTPQLYSHHLTECDGEDCSPCLKRDKYYIPIRIKKLPAFARGNETHKDQPLNYCLERNFAGWNQTPYWIFNLPAKIVPDHSEIFTDRFTDFLTAFLPPLSGMQAATAAPPGASRKAGAER